MFIQFGADKKKINLVLKIDYGDAMWLVDVNLVKL